MALLHHMHIMANRHRGVQPSSSQDHKVVGPAPGSVAEHPCNVSGGGRREQLCPHVCCAWEASAIPAQVFAHGLKRHTIVETLEVAGMLQGHLAALA